MDKKIRILIVDNNPILREGLKSVLSPIPIFDIVGEAADGLEAINLVERILPDLVLMDISMPRMNEIKAIREIKKKRPGTKILAYTVHKIPEILTATLKAGADGYLLKDSSIAELIQSIQDILDGKQGVHPRLMEEAPHRSFFIISFPSLGFFYIPFIRWGRSGDFGTDYLFQ